MRNTLIVLSVLALSFALFGEEKKYKVAVMEFDDQTKKLSKSVLEAAAEYLRGELVASNQFIVISKDRQKAIVKEQKKESWKECYDQSCRIQLGQALSSDTILTGTISKFGNAYTLTLELVDLAKEATIKGAKAEFNGTEIDLKKAIESVANKIIVPSKSEKDESQQQTSDSATPMVPQSSNADSGLTPYIKSCKEGNADSCHLLATMYYQGDGLPRDLAMAAKLYGMACEKGNAMGCSVLGYMYANGEGVTKNITHSLNLYNKACVGGYPVGCTRLGSIYYSGEIVTKDLDRAVTFFQKGCAGEEKVACSVLGTLYSKGDGVPSDKEMARKLYNKACVKGVAIACGNLGVMYYQGDGIPSDPETAAPLLQKGCDGGDVGSCAFLGVMYEDGNGVPIDPMKAKSFHKKACDGGIREACQYAE